MMTITTFEADGTIIERIQVADTRLTVIPIGVERLGAYSIFVTQHPALMTHHVPRNGRLEIDAESYVISECRLEAEANS